jgi:hypothetical protein
LNLTDSEDFDKNKLLSYAQFLAFSRGEDQVRHYFHELGLGNQERSRKESTLFSFKFAPRFHVLGETVLSVKIAPLRREMDHFKVGIAFLKETITNQALQPISEKNS